MFTSDDIFIWGGGGVWYQSPFSPDAASVSTTTRNSLRASFGSSSFRAAELPLVANDDGIGDEGVTLCVVVSVFHINVGLILLFILVNEVVVD